MKEVKEEQEDGAEETASFSYSFVTLPPGFSYSDIVNLLIEEEYPSDRMQAIINNHLFDGNDEEHENEYVEMQRYRAWAKRHARNFLARLDEIEDIDEYIKKHWYGSEFSV